MHSQYSPHNCYQFVLHSVFSVFFFSLSYPAFQTVLQIPTNAELLYVTLSNEQLADSTSFVSA